MKIRPATTLDIPQMIAIERDSATAAHWGEGQYAALFDSASLPRIVMVAEMSDQNMVSRSSIGRVCGFVVVRTLEVDWEIENVIVESAVRRSGIGTLLLTKVLQIGREQGCSRIFLEVRSSNHSARKLYEKHGFTEFGHRVGYYENPTEDAVLLQFEFRTSALENA